MEVRENKKSLTFNFHYCRFFFATKVKLQRISFTWQPCFPFAGVYALEGDVEAVDGPELLDDGGDLVRLERLLVVAERGLLERLQRLPEALHSHLDPLQALM